MEKEKKEDIEVKYGRNYRVNKKTKKNKIHNNNKVCTLLSYILGCTLFTIIAAAELQMVDFKKLPVESLKLFLGKTGV